MRFRKSIKIMKGVRLNFSGSGLSVTAGVRGASVNFGPRGTYVNTGIPGTGLYDRTRVGGTVARESTRSSGSRSSYIDLPITVGIEDDGSYFIRNRDGSPITDESVLRKIKRTEAYKAKILELGENFVTQKATESEAFVDVYKLSPALVPESDVRHQLETLEPLVYRRKTFDEKAPSKESIEIELAAEARRNIRSLAFWTLKEKRTHYVATNLPDRIQEAEATYSLALEKFNTVETELEKAKNREYLEAFNHKKAEILAFLTGDKGWVENKIDTFLSAMTLPVDFAVAYEYHELKGELYVDLDLPEIEDLPTTKATSLATGKVKVKEKSQKEVKEEYLRCISGLAFFFGCSFFNVSTNIRQILISGFTQRLNKKTGKVEDDYVYSIVFRRDQLADLEVANIDPVVAFDNFSHRRIVSKTFEVSSIVPFSEINAQD